MRPEEVERVELLEIKNGILSAANVTWQDFAGRIQIASDTLRQHGFSPANMRDSVCEEGILCLYCIDAPEDELAMAEEAIHEAIALQPYSPVDSVISFGCTVVDPDEIRA